MQSDTLGVGGTDLSGYDFEGRSGRRHRAEILRYLDFRRMNPEDRADLSIWISTELCPSGMTIGAMMDRVFLWCRDGKIFASSRKELERLARSQRQRFLDAYLSRVADRLHPQAQASMEASLADPDNETGFHSIKRDAGQASLDNIVAITVRLAFIRTLDLPADLLSVPGPVWIEQIEGRRQFAASRSLDAAAFCNVTMAHTRRRHPDLTESQTEGGRMRNRPF